MFSQFINPFLRALLAIAIIAASMLFNANAQTTDQNKNNKIHLKITKDINGNRTDIDTTFTSEADADAFLKSFNDEHDDMDDDAEDHQQARSFFFNFKDDSLNRHERNFNFNMSIPGWSDEERAKFEADMEKLKEEIKKENLFDMHWDTTGNNFNYNFNFRMPDEKEMEALKEKFNDMKFDFDFPPMPPMPPMPDFNPDVQGLNDADKKQFNEQMKRAEEEYQKAMELLKEKNGSIKSSPCPDFHFNYDHNGNNKTQKKVIIIEKSDAKTDKSKAAKKTKATVDESRSDNFKINDLKYFPNPSNGKFDLSFSLPGRGDLSVSITDASGRKVYNETMLDFSGDYSQSFDLTAHGAGVYLLNIQQGKEWLHKKVVVK